MTREEIKNIVRHVFHFYESNVENCNWTDMNEACGEILNLLEQESVLDKIRKRVELEKLGCVVHAGYYNALMKVLQIIDEYKVKVKGSENDNN